MYKTYKWGFNSVGNRKSLKYIIEIELFIRFYQYMRVYWIIRFMICDTCDMFVMNVSIYKVQSTEH